MQRAEQMDALDNATFQRSLCMRAAIGDCIDAGAATTQQDRLATYIERAIAVLRDIVERRDGHEARHLERFPLRRNRETLTGSPDCRSVLANFGTSRPFLLAREIGRASCRERVCQYGEISVDAVT